MVKIKFHKIISVAIIICILLTFVGCSYEKDKNTSKNTSGVLPSSNLTSSGDSSISTENLSEIPSNEIPSNNDLSQKVLDFKAVWIEYTDAMFNNTNKEKYIADARERFKNIKESGFNTVILHTRANADAIYPSNYFPFTARLTGTAGKDPGFDPLEIAIEIAHEMGLELHAWINPYRISAASDDITKLTENHIARIWKENVELNKDSYVIPYDGKLFFNPAEPEVQKLILDGVEEILENYNVDGIHFDDYFYPVKDANFDIGTYASYCRKAKYPLSQGDWRRSNVDTLVSAVYRLTKEYGKEFGISPAAPISADNTDRNYNEYFINVKKWMANRGYIDYIAPQLYFGYEHKATAYRFDALLKAWSETKRLDSVKLYIGLAAYKTGLNNNTDMDEWATHDDILAREYIDCLSVDTDGIIIYNYSSFFSDAELNKKQRENLLNIMNGEK